MTKKQLEALHKKSSLRRYIEKSRYCGCFYCLRIYKPSAIKEWVGRKGNDAICPKCGIDSVLGDAACKINSETLKAMKAHWFCKKTMMKGIPFSVLGDAK